MVRAIRNIFEHWFSPGPKHDEPRRLAAVAALTGWSAAELQRGQQSADAAAMRAAAVAEYFLRERFAGLLLVFEFGREWPSEA